MSIKFITDSTAYLPKRLIDQLDITILSLSVSFGEAIYKETDISNDFFFKTLDEFEGFPKSSQPSMQETEDIMRDFLSQGHDIIGTFISSDMSGTYQTTYLIAEGLKEEFPDRKIMILDSRSNCMQLGLCVLKGIEKAEVGFEAAVAAIEHTIKNSRFIFIPDTLEYLKRGGRIGSAKALLSSVLKIKPILTVQNGKTHVLSKVRTRKKAIDALVEIYKDTKGKITDTFIHHINCLEDTEAMSKKLNGEFEAVAIGPVIGTHVGPGAIGIAYCWE
jgi:DegV family protein with EDD domain